jgi:hypothetical protein
MTIRLTIRWAAALRPKMQRLASIVAIGGSFFAMTQSQALAQRFFYRFTSIADTEQGFPFSNLPGLGFGYPCQNSENRVAFEAQLANNLNTDGIFSRVGLGGIDDIADTNSPPYGGFGTFCSINANGSVLFLGYEGNGNAPLLLLGGAGTKIQTILTTKNGTYDGISRFELNNQGKAVVLAHRADNSGDVILTKVAGGSENTIATTFTGSPYTGFVSVSINSAGTVAFSATRPDSSEGIFIVSENGITQVLAGSNSGSIAAFDDIDLNDKGSVAFDGTDANGTPGVWRIDNTDSGYSPVITKITDSSVVGAVDFTGVSINNSGQVAYSFLDYSESSYVGLGNGSKFSLLGPIVVQPYTFVLGRFVADAFIIQDSLNDLGQLAVLIVFAGSPDTAPSSMIALAQIVDTLPYPLVPVTEFALSTGTGSAAGVHTSLKLPLQLLELAFDATFLSKQGELKVTLGDKLLKTVPASARGVRRSIRIPINMRLNDRPTKIPLPQELKFQVTGKPGTVVQVGNIRIPEAGLRWNPNRKNSRWHFDTQGGGWSGLVDATRFPVEIKEISPEPRQRSMTANTVLVAVLSTKSFDATKDIERDSLHFAAAPVRSERDAKGKEHPRCSERDVNGDQRPDLVCEFEAPSTSPVGSAQKPSRRLEGMTPYGWFVEGRLE